MRLPSRFALTVTAVVLSTSATALVPVPVLGTTAAPAVPHPSNFATSPRALAERADAADPVGVWRVQGTAEGTYQLTWTSPEALPVTDDRPEIWRDGQPVATPEVLADGRSVTLTVETPTRPDPADYDVMLSGTALDSTALPPIPANTPQAAVPAAPTLATDPGDPGTFQVVSSDYRVPGIKLAGMPAKIETLGHVVSPEGAAAGAPLVLFLHGRHEACYQTPDNLGGGFPEWPCRRGTSPIPSYLGYVYAQQLLASQGYVTVSISANGINAQDFNLADGGAAARAALIRRHLALWSGPDADDVIGDASQADLSSVILVGHSRGGEGAARASLSIPLGAPYNIRGQVLIGPTDFGRQTSAFIPTVTVLPYCDGDVSDLQGQIFTDLARDVRTDDNALHSSILVMGANHNFFNSEWTPGIAVAPSFDDWFGPRKATCGRDNPARLSASEQRKVGKSYIAGAVALMADGDNSMLPLFDGSHVGLASTDNTDVRSHAVGGGRDVRRPGIDAHPGPASGAVTRLCVGRVTEAPAARQCGRETSPFAAPHWLASFIDGPPTTRAFEMSWTAPDQTGGLRFDTPLDLTGDTSLDLRTIVDPSLGKVQLGFRVFDGPGHSMDVDAVDGGQLSPLPGGGFTLGKKWAQTLRLDVASLADLDPSHITRVDLVAKNVDGHIWVLDVAGSPDTLPVVQDQRAPLVTVHNINVQEGDQIGTRFAHVPFTLNGDVSAPSTFVVTGNDLTTFSELTPISVDVPAGVHSGTFDVPYASNRVDDARSRPIELAVFAKTGAMTNDYTSSVRITDDDPQPDVHFTRLNPTAKEGREARWRVNLSKPTGYYSIVFGTVARGPDGTPRLRVADVPQRWLASHLGTESLPDGSVPLDRIGLRLFAVFSPGERHVQIAVPTRRDAQVEGLEHVTLRVRVPQLFDASTRTIGITDRRPPA